MFFWRRGQKISDQVIDKNSWKKIPKQNCKQFFCKDKLFGVSKPGGNTRKKHLGLKWKE